MAQEQDQVVERFRPTSGQVLGWIGLGLVALLVVGGAVEGIWSVVTGALVAGVLVWAAMLKPRVLVAGRRLVLRNMLETVTVPLAAIEEVAVRQVLAVRVGERRFVSPAVGRSFRQALRSNRRAAAGGSATDLTKQAYPDFVEERIRHLAGEARTLEGIGRYSAEQEALGAEVRREPALLEIGLLVLTAVAFVVTLLL